MFTFILSPPYHHIISFTFTLSPSHPHYLMLTMLMHEGEPLQYLVGYVPHSGLREGLCSVLYHLIEVFLHVLKDEVEFVVLPHYLT